MLWSHKNPAGLDKETPNYLQTSPEIHNLQDKPQISLIQIQKKYKKDCACLNEARKRDLARSRLLVREAPRSSSVSKELLNLIFGLE